MYRHKENPDFAGVRVTRAEEKPFLMPYANYILDEIRKVDWEDPEIDREYQAWLQARKEASVCGA